MKTKSCSQFRRFLPGFAVPTFGHCHRSSTVRLILRQLILAAVLLSSFAFQAQAAEICAAVFTPEKAPYISERVAKNKFVTNRHFEEYARDLHPDFKNNIAKLSANQHWIDLGAGKATAQIDFLKTFSNKNQAPQATAVAFKLDRWFKPSSYEGKLKIEEGAYETMPTPSWKKADIITDVYGVLSYTANLSQALQKTIDLLNLEGELYLLISPFATQIKTNNEHITLTQYLKSIEGLKIEEGTTTSQLKITKTKNNIQIPPIEILRYTDQAPPLRTYTPKN
ncbi:hypothetical protein DOM22_17195 [Bdellovibrio sp. ZAP7]|uniref:hypothetical protein n=1 Tax=Bdellovibrio sp. ZAP7 TaxID=2231053 RepID=UPI00115B3925|nr:hypothetical protein [Bdellovibrio sp. ZAP7]QDK46768.1 hypothetical protein DOM22_17195 [Bdellovibrio sp. ZAP7]